MPATCRAAARPPARGGAGSAGRGRTAGGDSDGQATRGARGGLLGAQLGAVGARLAGGDARRPAPARRGVRASAAQAERERGERTPGDAAACGVGGAGARGGARRREPGGLACAPARRPGARAGGAAGPAGRRAGDSRALLGAPLVARGPPPCLRSSPRAPAWWLHAPRALASHQTRRSPWPPEPASGRRNEMVFSRVPPRRSI